MDADGPHRSGRLRPRRLAAAGGVLVLLLAVFMGVSPSSDVAWSTDHAVMPEARFDGDLVTVKGIRNFEYGSADEFTPAYYDRTFDLTELESVWYVLTPFSTDWRGPAHTFLSFGFADSSFVSVSVEARKRPGQDYSMLGGLFRRFQIIYVVGDERDLIGVRAVHRDDDVYVYPIRATREQVRDVFLSMMRRANQLRLEPEFYNTIFNNCTTNILDHVNQVAENKIRYSPRILLPGYSDEIAFERGLLDTDLTLEQARQRYRVNDRARSHAGAEAFSLRIREYGDG